MPVPFIGLSYNMLVCRTMSLPSFLLCRIVTFELENGSLYNNCGIEETNCDGVYVSFTNTYRVCFTKASWPHSMQSLSSLPNCVGQ